MLISSYVKSTPLRESDVQARNAALSPVTGIHLRIRQWYRDGMVTTDSCTPEPRRFAIPLPQWSTIVVVALVIISAVFSIGFGVHYLMRFHRIAADNSTLRTIYFAMAEYHEVHGAMPTVVSHDDGQTIPHSWRVAILPYLHSDPSAKHAAEAYSLDKPWDSEENRRALRAWAKSDGLIAHSTKYVRIVAINDPMSIWGKPAQTRDVRNPKAIAVLLSEPTPDDWGRPDMILERDGEFYLDNGDGTTRKINLRGLPTLYEDSSVSPFMWDKVE